MTEDYYQTLELPRNASPGDVKHAYRRLARKHHPDFNPGDPTAEDRMEDINRAYEVLSDKSKRENMTATSGRTGADRTACPAQKDVRGGGPARRRSGAPISLRDPPRIAESLSPRGAGCFRRLCCHLW